MCRGVCGVASCAASLIMMMRKIVWPRLEKFGAEVIQPHADNFYAIFKSVEAATRAAASISNAIAAYNEGKDADYKISLGGMGVSWGADVRNLGHTVRGMHTHILTQRRVTFLTHVCVCVWMASCTGCLCKRPLCWGRMCVMAGTCW